MAVTRRRINNNQTITVCVSGRPAELVSTCRRMSCQWSTVRRRREINRGWWRLQVQVALVIIMEYFFFYIGTQVSTVTGYGGVRYREGYSYSKITGHYELGEGWDGIRSEERSRRGGQEGEWREAR